MPRSVDSSDYVVITEHDGVEPLRGNLVLETYVSMASIEHAVSRKSSMETAYGKCRIAKLVYLSESEVDAILKGKNQTMGNPSPDL